MRTITGLVSATLLFVAMGAPAPAATVSFDGVNGVTDGGHYISPFRISIDGETYQTMCYDFGNTVAFGQSWQAVLYDFSDLSNAYYSDQSDYVNKYRKAAWLFAQLLDANTPDDLIGIQHAVWTLFTSSAPSSGAQAWLAAAADAQQAGFAGVGFDDIRIVNSLPGAVRVQGFFVESFAVSETPEPATLLTLGMALILLGWFMRRSDRKKNPTPTDER